GRRGASRRAAASPVADAFHRRRRRLDDGGAHPRRVVHRGSGRRRSRIREPTPVTAQSAARAGMRRLRLGATQQNAVLAVLTVVVAALVLGPVVVLIRASFTPADSMPLESWAVTLANFVTLLVSSSTARLVFNTMVYALS